MTADELTALRELLAEPLNTDNGHALAGQLAIRGSWQARVSLAHREAEQELSRARGAFFNPSLSSEDKRKIDLEHKTREYAKIAGEYYDLTRILSEQLSLGQSLLKSIESEVRAQLK